MRAILEIMRLELIRFFADPKGAVLTVMMPLALGALLGMLFAPDALSGQVKLLVADEDGGPEIKGLIEALGESGALSVEAVTRAAGEAEVRAGRAPALLVIPPGTAEALAPARLLDGERPTAPLLYDPARAAERARAEGALQRAVIRHTLAGLARPQALAQLLRSLSAKAAALPGPVAARAQALLSESAALLETLATGPGISGLSLSLDSLPPPLRVEAAAVSEGNGAGGYQPYAHTFAGMLCQFLMFMAAGLARGLIADRGRGITDRIAAAPIRPAMALLGAGAGAALIALLGSVVVYGIAIPVFAVPVDGSWLGLGLVLVGQAVFIGGFTLLLAGLGRTERQVETLGTFVILTASFLGGAWIPSFLMPSWVQGLAHGVPVWWATEGLAAMTWRGLELHTALTAAGALVGFGVASGAVGLWRLR